MGNVVISFLLALTLFGCAAGPNYQRPSVETPPSWRFEEKDAREVANTAWWGQFDDPVLNELIQTALAENRNLKIAAARVEEFMGRHVATRAALFPQVGAGASAGRSRITEKGYAPLSSAIENPYDDYQAFLNASWEIDLWGKLRRATEAARADLLSMEEGRRAVILTLVTSVASAYVNLRDLDKQLEIAKRTVESREDNYSLFKLRFEKGVISETELYQAKSEYEQALLRYQQAIQASFQDVEDALVDQKKSREQLEVQERLLESLRNYVRLARLRFDNGYTSYIEVLDAERRLFTAELLQAETKGVFFQALVNFYKAMGGSWILEADRVTGRTADLRISTHGSEVLHANQ